MYLLGDQKIGIDYRIMERTKGSKLIGLDHHNTNIHMRLINLIRFNPHANSSMNLLLMMSLLVP